MNTTIEITLHPDQPARPQLDAALANMQPKSCPRHAHELLPFNHQTSLNHIVKSGTVAAGNVISVFNRCSNCPHNLADDIEVRDCAAERASHPRRIDPDGKPLPYRSEDLEISLDESLNTALANLGMKMERAGMKCSNETLAFRKMVPPKSKVLTLHLDFATCPACVLERMGLTPDEARASFNNFVCDPPILEQYLRACQEFASFPKGVLPLLGNTGTGKTHLGTAILRERIVRGDRNLLFIKMRHLLDQHWQSIRSVAFDAEQPVSPLQRCQRAPLLMLDELTTLPKHFDAEGFLLDLFEERIGNHRPTIITGNLNRDELEAAVGSRLFDRLRRASIALLEFGFESKRPQFNQDYLSRDVR